MADLVDIDKAIPGDLLVREVSKEAATPSGWHRIDSWLSDVAIRIKQGNEPDTPLPGAVVRFKSGVDSIGLCVPDPNESPMHYAGDPCHYCDELRLWQKAFDAWEDSQDG